jgi:FMN phosphatase YigB (HAD superfamily)
MRPLLITDCDEVLVHMVSPFRDWLSEAHDVAFTIENGDFLNALSRRACGTKLTVEEIWELLDGFFLTEMHRQPAAPGAAQALRRIAEQADVVILTNLQDHYAVARAAQLEALDMPYRVATNQGPKGPALKRLVEEYGATRTVFVDDLAQHHASVAEVLPQVSRLHMIAEPVMQSIVPPAPAAHARIDDWETATPWILERLAA